jgi:TolB protein
MSDPRPAPALFLLLLIALPFTASAQKPAPVPVTNGALPVVSPDGIRIAFLSNRGGVEDLYVIAANGTGETQLTRTPEATRLMVSAADGSNAKQINDGASIAWNSHWSPDGKRIAFTGRPDSSDGLAVFVMNSDGSGRRQVTHFAPGEGRAQWPVWSPDGRELAIQANDIEAHSCHIWIVDASTGGARKLAAHGEPYLDETPSWFPDGKRIAFQSNRTGRMEVWVMNTDGSGQRQVTGLSK